MNWRQWAIYRVPVSLYKRHEEYGKLETCITVEPR